MLIRKIYCLYPRPCIIQTGNFTGSGSEGVKPHSHHIGVSVQCRHSDIVRARVDGRYRGAWTACADKGHGRHALTDQTRDDDVHVNKASGPDITRAFAWRGLCASLSCGCYRGTVC